MQSMSDRINHFQDSIFATMSLKAQQVGAVNLGQGYPDFDGPEWLKELATKSVSVGNNQYAPFMGIPSLRQQLSRVARERYALNYDPATQITITNGATEAIFISILALVNPGDEVVIFEPFYDSYVATIKMAGGIPIPVTLHAPKFQYDEHELKAAFSGKTKLVILNTPHNPSGKVFERSELEVICQLVKQHDAYLMSDEVYEFLTFDGAKHIPPASLPDMQERTLTISSAGKTFGVTGWKIGWVMTSPELSRALRLVHQYNTFSVSTPMQFAVAEALSRLDTYLPEFQAVYLAKRNFLISGLRDKGWNPITPQGTYFVLCPIKQKTKLNDVAFAMELIEQRQIALIPPSAFYMHSNEGEGFLRFCFAKRDETLRKALDCL